MSRPRPRAGPHRTANSCSGSKGAAEQGELVYYVGGTDEALREGRPILEASSKEILHIGAVGQASAIKVATNMVSAASVQATAEALGTGFLVAIVVGSGIYAQRLSPNDTGLQLLENSMATGLFTLSSVGSCMVTLGSLANSGWSPVAVGTK